MKLSMLTRDSVYMNGWQDFVESQVRPMLEYCEKDAIPKSLYHAAGKRGLLTLPAPHDSLQHSHDMITALMTTGHQGLAMFMSAYKVVTSLLHDHGSEYIRQNIVKNILAGDYFIPLGITEPLAGSSLSNLETKAIDRGDYWLINGCKKFICSMNVANYMLTLVRLGADDLPRFSLVLVPVDVGGVSITSLEIEGWQGVHVSEVQLQNVKVCKKNLVGEPGEALTYLGHALSLERFHLALLALESAKFSHAITVEYAKSRLIRGQQLIRKQAVSHLLSETKTLIFIMQSALQSFISNSNIHSENFPILASQLKFYFTTQAEKITSNMLHLHGAQGFLSDSLIQRLSSDCKLLCIGGGTSEVMLNMISRSL